MKNETIRKDLHVDKPNSISIFNFKEGDNALIKLALYKNSLPFDLTGQTVTLGAKTSGNLFQQTDNIVIALNNLDITLKNSILLSAGEVEIELKIQDLVGSMTTTSFFITVIPKVLNDGAVQATNEFDTFTKTVTKIEEDYANFKNNNSGSEELEAKFNTLLKKLKFEDLNNILEFDDTSVKNYYTLYSSGGIGEGGYCDCYIDKFIPIEAGRAYYLKLDESFPIPEEPYSISIKIHFYNNIGATSSLNYLQYNGLFLFGNIAYKWSMPEHNTSTSFDYRNFFISTELTSRSWGEFKEYGLPYIGVPLSVAYSRGIAGGFVFPKLFSAIQPCIRVAFNLFGTDNNLAECYGLINAAKAVKIVAGAKLW